MGVRRLRIRFGNSPVQEVADRTVTLFSVTVAAYLITTRMIGIAPEIQEVTK